MNAYQQHQQDRNLTQGLLGALQKKNPDAYNMLKPLADKGGSFAQINDMFKEFFPEQKKTEGAWFESPPDKQGHTQEKFVLDTETPPADWRSSAFKPPTPQKQDDFMNWFNKSPAEGGPPAGTSELAARKMWADAGFKPAVTNVNVNTATPLGPNDVFKFPDPKNPGKFNYYTLDRNKQGDVSYRPITPPPGATDVAPLEPKAPPADPNKMTLAQRRAAVEKARNDAIARETKSSYFGKTHKPGTGPMAEARVKRETVVNLKAEGYDPLDFGLDPDTGEPLATYDSGAK